MSTDGGGGDAGAAAGAAARENKDPSFLLGITTMEPSSAHHPLTRDQEEGIEISGEKGGRGIGIGIGGGGGPPPVFFGPRVWLWARMASFELLSVPLSELPRARENAKTFFQTHLFAVLYCPACALHYRFILNKVPPPVGSVKELSAWMVGAHNAVNARLDKPLWNLRRARREYWAARCEASISNEEARCEASVSNDSFCLNKSRVIGQTFQRVGEMYAFEAFASSSGTPTLAEIEHALNFYEIVLPASLLGSSSWYTSYTRLYKNKSADTSSREALGKWWVSFQNELNITTGSGLAICTFEEALFSYMTERQAIIAVALAERRTSMIALAARKEVAEIKTVKAAVNEVNEEAATKGSIVSSSCPSSPSSSATISSARVLPSRQVTETIQGLLLDHGLMEEETMKIKEKNKTPSVRRQVALCLQVTGALSFLIMWRKSTTILLPLSLPW